MKIAEGTVDSTATVTTLATITTAATFATSPIFLVVFVVVVAIVPEAHQPSVVIQLSSSQVSIFLEGKKDGPLNKHLPTPKAEPIERGGVKNV